MVIPDDDEPRGLRAPSRKRKVRRGERKRAANSLPPRNRRSGPAISAEKTSAAVREIAATILVLESMYSASVALGLALQQQNAEHDGDLAVCMRLQIANVIEGVIERLIGAGRHLGAKIYNPLRQ